MLKNISDFIVDTFSGRQAHRRRTSADEGPSDKDVPAIVLENCVDGAVRNSSSSHGTSMFVHITGAATKDLAVIDNRTGKAKRPLSLENTSIKKSVTTDYRCDRST